MFQAHTIRGRTLLIAILSLVVPLTAILVALFFLLAIHDKTRQVVTENIPITKALTDITVSQLEQEIHLERAIAFGSQMNAGPSIERSFQNNVNRFFTENEHIEEAFANALKMIDDATAAAEKESRVQSSLSGLKVEIETALYAHIEYVRIGETILDALLAGQFPLNEQSLIDLEGIEEDLDKQLVSALLHIEEITEQALIDTERMETLAENVVIGLTILGLIGGPLIGVYVGRSVSRPVEIAAKNLHLLNEGKTEISAIRSSSTLAEIEILDAAVKQYRDSIITGERALSQAKTNRAQFDSIANTAADGIILTDQFGDIKFYNTACEALLGHQKDEVVGRNISRILPQKFDADYGKMARQHAAANKDAVIEAGDEFDAVRKNGSAVPVEMSIGYAITDDGPVFVAVLRDVTERREMEEALHEQSRDLEKALAREKRINQLQQDFVSMTAHEFRTPLAIIDASAQRVRRLVKGKTADDEVSKRLETVQRNTERIVRLIDTTLDAARMDADKLELKPSSFDLINLCEKTVQHFNELTGPKRISLVTNSETLELTADEKMIERVLENLVANAVKYTPETAPIRIDALSTENKAVVRVIDHGPGIPEHELDGVFDQFFRGQNSGGTAGTGLGLYTCKHLIEMHGGTIKVESPYKDNSTCFEFSLPLVHETKTAQASIDA